jgi:hypothetical protein
MSRQTGGWRHTRYFPYLKVRQVPPSVPVGRRTSRQDISLLSLQTWTQSIWIMADERRLYRGHRYSTAWSSTPRHGGHFSFLWYCMARQSRIGTMLIGRNTSSAISLRGQRNPELPLERRRLLLPCRTRASEHGFEALPWILEGRVSLLCEVGICDDAVEFVGGRSVTRARMD